MKKVIISAVLLLLITACILSAGCVHDKETYTVAVDPALQPFSLMAESGELDGFDIEMMKWIAENQNFNIKFVGVTYNEYMTNVDKGNYDIRPGLIITDGRKENVDFSDPYVESHYSIVSRKDKTVTKEDVLSGNAVISVAVGSAYDVWVKNYFGEEKYNQMVKDGKILIERSVDQSILSVLAGSSDAAICADIIAVTQSDYYAPIKFIGYLDGNAQISISVKKGNEELLKKLNDGIANFKTSSRYNELKQKYRMPYLKDTYRVGVDSNNKPFTYLNENEDLTGIDYDSIMWIADKYGFDVEFVEGNWVSNINSVFRQEIDMW
ncbi:MAG: transporter substrate-binding domain-containing protein, partial [Methanocorpusculum sp.]|nr:transporter substrate-binding domain-containing protein [Methanocorpusculum sp.]